MSQTQQLLQADHDKINKVNEKRNLFQSKNKYLFTWLLIWITVIILLIAIYSSYSLNLLNDTGFHKIFGIYYNQTNDNIQNSVTELPKLTEKRKELSCDPILRNVAQYTIEIEGIKYPRHVPLYLNASINFKCLDNSHKTKTILFYNTWFGNAQFSVGLGVRGPFQRQQCPVTSCETTSDKSRLNESDFVVTHMRDSIAELPKNRPPNQRWIFLLYESPVHSGDFTKYNNFYNLTATYRLDSDFPGIYETGAGFIWKKNEDFDENLDFSSLKSEFAVAVISNCHASSQRLEYIHQMQKFVSVNVFGTCGQKCPSKYKNGNPGICKQILATEYKFYLSFENSVCKDYVTEKFFGILKYNIIPVVLSGGKYDSYVRK